MRRKQKCREKVGMYIAREQCNTEASQWGSISLRLALAYKGIGNTEAAIN